MENAMMVGLSQQIALRRAIDVTANNIANMNSTAFKAERLSFQQFLQPFEDDGKRDALNFVYDADTYTDFSEGGLSQTNASFDVAIEGKGFFQVQTQDGPRYTRDGHFGLDTTGQLVTRDGDPVLDVSGAPILIDPKLGQVSIGKDGVISQDRQQVGQLGVYDFDNPAAMRRVGGGLFETGEAAYPAEKAQVRQGFLESSNLQPIAAITQMLAMSRAYEGATKLIETANDLSRSAVRTLSQN